MLAPAQHAGVARPAVGTAQQTDLEKKCDGEHINGLCSTTLMFVWLTTAAAPKTFEGLRVLCWRQLRVPGQQGGFVKQGRPCPVGYLDYHSPCPQNCF